MLKWLKQVVQRKPFAQELVVVDDRGVQRHLRDGTIEEVAWTDLTEVTIVTTDDGPYGEDVFFLLVGSGGKGCVVPQGSSQSGPLLERLQRLPGFDNAKFIEAMGSAENARFLCWKKA